jgi:hypothetical protein
MATYHALVTKNGVFAVVRSAEDGVTDDEFVHGVRVSPRGYRSSKMVLLDEMLSAGFEVCDDDYWKEMFATNEIPNDHFIYKERQDKWDTTRVIY